MHEHSLLVVDDEPAVLESLTEFFQGQGLAAETASSEEEAYQKAMACHPEVVVSDLVLGEGGSGLSLIQRLKRVAVPGPCCILMSGRGTMSNAIEAIRVGVDDFLIKPVKLEELGQAVDAGMARQRYQKGEAQVEQAMLEGLYNDVWGPAVLMRAYIDMLGDGRFGPLVDLQKEKVEVVRRNLGRMMRSLRSFHSGSSGLAESRGTSPVHPGRLLKMAQEHFFLDFERRGVNVSLKSVSELPEVMVDETEALALLESLLGNCLALADFGMTLQIDWDLNSSQLNLHFKLEPFIGREVSGSLPPMFETRLPKETGLHLEANDRRGCWTLCFTQLATRVA